MQKRTATKIVCGLVISLVLIGIAIVLLRTVGLIQSLPGNIPLPMDAYDAGFVRQPALTFLHMIPGLIFVILGPLQFVAKIRNRYPDIHRWCGRIYVACGLLVGVTALILGIVIGFAGPTETSAVMFFSALFLISLGIAVYRIRRREIAAHREWMIRAFALGLAITTMRPMVALLTALAGLSFREALGISFWLAFSLHLVFAECWISFTGARQTFWRTAVDPQQGVAADTPQAARH